jgi:hypothetical protein
MSIPRQHNRKYTIYNLKFAKIRKNFEEFKTCEFEGKVLKLRPYFTRIHTDFLLIYTDNLKRQIRVHPFLICVYPESKRHFFNTLKFRLRLGRQRFNRNRSRWFHNTLYYGNYIVFILRGFKGSFRHKPLSVPI